MATCNTSELLAPTACCDTFSEHDLLRMLVGARCRLLHVLSPMTICDFSELLQSTAALAGKSRHDLLRILIGVDCEILSGGGISGASCTLCGNGDPVAAPDCDCATYYDKLNGAQWIWDDDVLIWRQISGGP